MQKLKSPDANSSTNEADASNAVDGYIPQTDNGIHVFLLIFSN